MLAPLLALVVGGVVAARGSGRPRRGALVGLVVSSSAVWLIYVGLYQHQTPCSSGTTGCPTVYGYGAPLPDEHPLGMAILLVGFAIPAAWSGWRRLAPPLTTGASLAVGPTLVAWWTAPRGDNDGLWTLVLWLLPILGGGAAVVAAVAQRIAANRRQAGKRGETAEASIASSSERLAALVIDVAVRRLLSSCSLSAVRAGP